MTKTNTALEDLYLGTPILVTWRDAASEDAWIYKTEARPITLLIDSVGMFHSIYEDALLLMGSSGSHGMGSGWLTIPVPLIRKWEILHAA